MPAVEEIIETELERVERWRAGPDTVTAKVGRRKAGTRFKLAPPRPSSSLMGPLAQVALEPNAGDFRLFDRRPLDALLQLRERSRFLRGHGFSETPLRADGATIVEL